MTDTVSDGTIIDRFTDALTAGDAEAARACLTDDAVIWHNFDAVAQDYEAAAQGWQALFTYFSDRAFTDIRRAAIPGGFVQQHLMAATNSAGERIGWPIVIIVRIRDGKIARFEEYIDRAGKLTLTAGQTDVPGLASAA
jgi:ketosteroid isomerase-like protein